MNTACTPISNLVITCRLWLRLAQFLQQQHHLNLSPVPSGGPRATLKLKKTKQKKNLKAIWQQNRQNVVQAVFMTFMALHRHGYWPMTTVSWEPDKHSTRHMMQMDEGETNQTDASATGGAFVNCISVTGSSGQPGHFTHKSGSHYIMRIINSVKKESWNENKTMPKRRLEIQGKGVGMINYVMVEKMWH